MFSILLVNCLGKGVIPVKGRGFVVTDVTYDDNSNRFTEDKASKGAERM